MRSRSWLIFDVRLFDDMRRKKLMVAVATAHLLTWFWLLNWASERADEGSAIVPAIGIGVMLAAWLQYRTVISLRRAASAQAEPVARANELTLQ